MSYSTATTPRTSVELAKEPVVSSSACSVNTATTSTSKSKVSTIWGAIKRHAKEHHEGVNAAYAAYYGAPDARRPQQEVWEYKRGVRKN